MTQANWQNRTLWTGDNLDILRGMNAASVDLIYLDPPFNSNRNYAAPIGSEAAGAAFKDTWTLDDVDMAWHGEIAEQEPALYAVIDAAGLSHSKGMKSFLIMMAVRLLEMRRVLKPTGSIYLHCDPTAGACLKMLPDAVLGRTNFGRQEGLCGGCGVAFPFRNFTIDHVVPRAKGGTDHLENLQLLCAACNSVKGRGTQAELKARLRAQGVIG